MSVRCGTFLAFVMFNILLQCMSTVQYWDTSMGKRELVEHDHCFLVYVLCVIVCFLFLLV